MSIGHRHAPDHKILAGRERELRELLDEPRFAAAVRAYDREDDTHEVPYGGGSGTDWRTIYWDHRVANAINAGHFRLGGKPIDPRPTGKAHEAVEGAILHLWEPVRSLLGWPETTERYQRAHDIADLAERHAVAHHGWDWQEYQRQWEQLIEPIERARVTNPPPNLLLEPYRGSPLFVRLAARTTASPGSGRPASISQPGQTTMPAKYPEMPEPSEAAEPEGGKLSHAEVHYSMAKPRSPERCATCEHYRGRDDCEIVRAPIYPAGWCDRWEGAEQEAAEAAQGIEGPAEEAAEAAPRPDALAHGRAIAGAKALHAVGHISAEDKDRHVKASQAALKRAPGGPRKPFGSFSP